MIPPTPVITDPGLVHAEVPAAPSSGSTRMIVKPKLPKLVMHKFNKRNYKVLNILGQL